MPATGRRLTQVADAAGISKQAVAQLVDDLVDKGYLERRPAASDRRAKIIVPAERGRAAHAATLDIFASMEAEIAGVLGERTLHHLKSSLSRLLSSLVLARKA